MVGTLHAALGIRTRILPMADGPVRTQVRTDDGWLDFQEYFVHLRQVPEVREVRFAGDLEPTPQVVEAIEAADVVVHRPVEPDRVDRADPGRADPGAGRGAGPCRHPGRGRQPDRRRGRAQGPGRPDAGLARSRIRAPGEWPGSTATSPRRFVLDTVDAALEPDIAALGLRTHVTDTIMADAPGRARLARTVLEAVA